MCPELPRCPYWPFCAAKQELSPGKTLALPKIEQVRQGETGRESLAKNPARSAPAPENFPKQLKTQARDLPVLLFLSHLVLLFFSPFLRLLFFL